MSLVVQPINLDYINSNRDKFNSNNHWINNKRPEDYDKKMEHVKTSKWIDLFHNSYIVIEFDKNDIRFLKEAYKIGSITKSYPKLYNEELDDLLRKYSHLDKYFDGTKYFVRSEDTSLKTSIHKAGPYINLKQIIEGLTTCSYTHTPINEHTKELKIYLLKWLDLNHDKEFRVFVNNKKITCISQQYWYNKNMIGESELINYVEIIIDYLNNFISNTEYFNKNSSVVIDIILLENLKPYIIEFNPFGKEYSSGSSLFHWLLDEELLYNSDDENNTYFRYVE